MTNKESSPVSELVQRLRSAVGYSPYIGYALFAETADRLTALEAEVRRCHARLEIDHHFILDGEDAENLVRVEIPYEDRDGQVDGIEARDATIKELERQIESLTAPQGGDNGE